MILLLTGCGNRATQTETEDSTNQNYQEVEVNTDNVKITFPDDDVIKIRMNGKSFVDAISRNGYLDIRFYNAGEGMFADGQGINMQVWSNQCSAGYLDATDRNNMSFERFTDTAGQDINGFVITGEADILLKIEVSDIAKLVQDFDFYEVVEPDKMLYTGTISQDVTDEWYNITPLPEEYVNDGDGDFFKPVTDRYHVMKLDYPEYKVADLEWGVDYTSAAPFPGAICYTPMKAHDSNVSVVLLESYDEFGTLIDAKAKVIYERSEDAMVAGVTRVNGLYPALINGVNEEDNAVLEEHLADFLEDCLKESMANYESDSGKTSCDYYDGHVDNILYFDYGTDLIEGNYFVVHSLSQISAYINRVVWNELDAAHELNQSFDYSYYYDNLEKSNTIVIEATGKKIGYSTIPTEVTILNGTQEMDLTKSGFPNEVYQNGFEDYPNDENYFRPISEDYVLWYMVEPWDEGTTKNFEAYLAAFNDNGELIQYVKRYMKAPNVVNDMQELLESVSFDGMELLYSDESTYYSDQTQYVNSSGMYSGRQGLIESVSRDALTDGSGIYVYISKP